MTIRNLEYAFRPRSVSVIGASDEPGSVGKTLTENVLTGGFAGPIYLVNPRHQLVAGVRCFRDVEALPEAPELAVIATPPNTVPTLIDALGKKGTRAAVVITAGLGNDLRQAMLNAACPYCLRIIGPNCLGLWVPALGLNANFGFGTPQVGKLALLAQSGALIGGVLDWAAARGIGFSTVVSMGDMADVDVEFANVAVAVSRAYTKSHRDVVLRFLKAYVEGTRRFMTDKEFGIKALRKYTGSQDQEILSKTYDLFASKYIKKNPTLSLKGVETTLAMIADRNPKAKGCRAEEFVDMSLMDELEKTGFMR